MPLKTFTEIQGAPKAVGPYSIAAEANGFLFLSGQIGINPVSGKIDGTTVGAQAEQVLSNIQAVLRDRGLDLSDVLKSMILLTDMNDFGAVNEVYAAHFGSHKPARSTFAVAALPLGARIEIEVVAVCR